MSFVYARVIRFHETDAAGVVYFANLLTLCHEAYEAALAEAGVDLKQFFSSAGSSEDDSNEEGGIAVPIVHAEADFYRPLFCGDVIAIILIPTQLTLHSFEIAYRIVAQADLSADFVKPLARASTRHICINTQSRRRHPLTTELSDWIAALSDPATGPVAGPAAEPAPPRD